MKEAYYFSHDANARRDPKIIAMRGVYGMEGYAWYWVLVEMMREQDGYKLDMRPKYAFNAFASEMQCDAEKAQIFIKDCIHEFGLFSSDDSLFWSESLLRRMREKEEKSEKARRSAKARWSRKGASDKDSPPKEDETQCDDDANASKNDALKESKGKESKRNKNKDIKTSPRQRKTYAEDSPPFKMALYLHGKIMAFAEGIGVSHLVRNSDMQKWADGCHKILEIDNRDRAEAAMLIDWATADPFWQRNVLSPDSFRKQYDRLLIEMAAEKNKPKQRKGNGSFKDMAEELKRQREENGK